MKAAQSMLVNCEPWSEWIGTRYMGLRRQAAIAARTALVADLCLDTRKSGQPGNAVRAAGLAVIQQVIVQLAVAINLAAVVPGLSDQLRLPSIFQSPQAQPVSPAAGGPRGSARRSTLRF